MQTFELKFKQSGGMETIEAYHLLIHIDPIRPGFKAGRDQSHTLKSAPGIQDSSSLVMKTKSSTISERL